VPFCDWGYAYDIFSDEESENVALSQKIQGQLREMVQPTVTGGTNSADSLSDLYDLTRSHIESDFKTYTGWLSAIEITLKHVAARTSGEHPALPGLDHVLTTIRQQLTSLRTNMEQIGAIAMSEPDRDEVSLICESLRLTIMTK